MQELNLNALLTSFEGNREEALDQRLKECVAQNDKKYLELVNTLGHGHTDGNIGMIILVEVLRDNGIIVADAIPIVYKNNEEAEKGYEKHSKLMMESMALKNPDHQLGRTSIINHYQH